jgi:hypothetical protein
LPRLLDILLADKTGAGPNGRAPLSSGFILKLLLDVSAITANLGTLESNANLVLDAGGVFALVGLLQVRCRRRRRWQPGPQGSARGV